MTHAAHPRIDLSIGALVLPDAPAAEQARVAALVAQRLEERLASEPLAGSLEGLEIEIPEIAYDPKAAWARGMLAEAIAAAVVKSVVAAIHRSAARARPPEEST